MSVAATLRARLSPANHLQDWLLRRVRTRRGATPLPFEFEYRHIYVMPTAFGTGFGIMLVCMALGGLNFNNNMALMLVFTLGIIAQLTTILAYRNLAGLRLASISAEPVFCGEQAHFRVYLGNTEERSRFAIQAGFDADQDCRDLPSCSTQSLQLDLKSEQRGWLRLPHFRLETRYPLGLFRAWSWFFPEARCLVYPAPAAHPPPLPTRAGGRSGRPVKGDGELVHGLREYRIGDPLKRVAWRTSARHDTLYTREMESPRQDTCELAWDALPGLDTEARLSVLVSWVLLADRHQLQFSLALPGKWIPPGQGPDHRALCLEALALHGK